MATNDISQQLLDRANQLLAQTNESTRFQTYEELQQHCAAFFLASLQRALHIVLPNVNRTPTSRADHLQNAGVFLQAMQEHSQVKLPSHVTAESICDGNVQTLQSCLEAVERLVNPQSKTAARTGQKNSAETAKVAPITGPQMEKHLKESALQKWNKLLDACHIPMLHNFPELKQDCSSLLVLVVESIMKNVEVVIKAIEHVVNHPVEHITPADYAKGDITALLQMADVVTEIYRALYKTTRSRLYNVLSARSESISRKKTVKKFSTVMKRGSMSPKTQLGTPSNLQTKRASKRTPVTRTSLAQAVERDTVSRKVSRRSTKRSSSIPKKQSLRKKLTEWRIVQQKNSASESGPLKEPTIEVNDVPERTTRLGDELAVAAALSPPSISTVPEKDHDNTVRTPIAANERSFSSVTLNDSDAESEGETPKNKDKKRGRHITLNSLPEIDVRDILEEDEVEPDENSPELAYQDMLARHMMLVSKRYEEDEQKRKQRMLKTLQRKNHADKVWMRKIELELDKELSYRAKMRRSQEEKAIRQVFQTALKMEQGYLREQERLFREQKKQLEYEWNNKRDAIENFFRQKYDLLKEEINSERTKRSLEEADQRRMLEKMEKQFRNDRKETLEQLRQQLRSSDEAERLRTIQPQKVLQRLLDMN